MVSLTQTDAVLLGETAAKNLDRQDKALTELGKRLDEAVPPPDTVTRRFDFHQPLPAGLLAITLSRCAQLCSKQTTIWRSDLVTMMPMDADGSGKPIEVSLGQQGISRVVVSARCDAGNHHAVLLQKVQLFICKLLEVRKKLTWEPTGRA